MMSLRAFKIGGVELPFLRRIHLPFTGTPEPAKMPAPE